LAEARPLAFKPPFGFLPSFRVHAGDLAIEHRAMHVGCKKSSDSVFSHNTFSGNN
jgi:hypothetical protein